MPFFNMQDYWAHRLENDFSLSSIGYKGLGIKYNIWLYRKRAKVLNNVIKDYLNISENTRIIELGVGSGFYINLWQKKGVKKFIGVDITEQSVKTLSKIYPHYNFQKYDISSEIFISIINMMLLQYLMYCFILLTIKDLRQL